MARQRHDQMADWIRRDPAKAVLAALPPADRARLPSILDPYVERHLEGIGDLEVLCVFPEPGRRHSLPPMQRFAVMGGERLQAFPVDPALGHITRREAWIEGVALEDAIAVSRLEVSGRAAVGEGGDAVLAESAATEGLKRLILIRVDFSDLPGEPFSSNRAAQLTVEVDRFFRENSYGRAAFAAIAEGSDVTPVLRLGRTAAAYGRLDPSVLRSDARNAARNAGYLLENYEYDITCMGNVPGFAWAGLGYVGARGAWIRGTSSTGVTVHELGHNFGLNHANFWDTGGLSVTGPGESIEYGDKFDTMGAANAGRYHFNARYKRLLGWLQPGEFTVATSNGTYRIVAHDLADPPPGSRGLQVFANASTNYWVELRSQFTANAALMGGVSLRWAGRANEPSLLLDTTPGSSGEKDDAPLLLGRTFSDPAAGIHLTPVAQGSSPAPWMDIVVQRGHFPSNRPPRLTVTASAAQGSTATPFRFIATADDPDGDPVVFSWDFADRTTAGNVADPVHQFASNGEYRVQCTASDTRGGITRASTVVRVGTPTLVTFRGTVTADGEPAGSVRIATSSTRVAFTDSDGTFALPLPVGTVTLTATAPDGTRFEPVGFQNPIAVVTAREGLDFALPETAGREPVTLVPAGAQWRYWDRGTLPSDEWAASGYDDSNWNVGPAILGYGGDRETTVISFGSSSSQKHVTAWFRRAFVVSDPGELESAQVELLRDDGAVVYLNGRELFRDNMPAGTITASTLASSTVGGAEELLYRPFPLNTAELAAGTNVLAVEVHQVSRSSSDTAFDLRLIAERKPSAFTGVRLTRPEAGSMFTSPASLVLAASVGDLAGTTATSVRFLASGAELGSASRPPYSITWFQPPPDDHQVEAVVTTSAGTEVRSSPILISIRDAALQPLLVPRGSRWRYLDTGEVPGADWIQPGFDDSAWSEGPARLGFGEDGEFTLLRYGDDPARKRITTWFRHAFRVTNVAAITNLACRLQRDDGAIVYLNGAEIFRNGLRSGAVTPSVLAQAEIQGLAEQAFVERALPVATLVEGMNVIAAEVHLASVASEDLGFDLELAAWRSALSAAPVLAARRLGDLLELSWDDASGTAQLESSHAVGMDAAWTRVGGTPSVDGTRRRQTVLLGEGARYFRVRLP